MLNLRLEASWHHGLSTAGLGLRFCGSGVGQPVQVPHFELCVRTMLCKGSCFHSFVLQSFRISLLHASFDVYMLIENILVLLI